LVRLLPVTVDDGIDVHISASYFHKRNEFDNCSCGRLAIFAVVFVESRIRIIYWRRGRYAVYYVPYFLVFSNFVLFFHFPISYNF
jgi:hypothetical protein